MTKGDVGHWHDVRDVNELVSVVFSGLPALVIEGVADEGEVIRQVARVRSTSTHAHQRTGAPHFRPVVKP
ncbi:hypothetical protein [Kitasatospora purpeofusca]|uniref:hypothetical protein n=1 Tax=Kitasatospora purpeofusca TaxID=67352 RepID=UPI002251ECE5|nr:hypothetical protein [Kitasatospora purpeofusca]MCX4755675.1 hypothetical protein [Kitasatospora purpeofusca]WSR36463.1 hypothetical protein OG715_39215 [Kitasatospora purpeofusca]WSR44748.1 hypothetical protein OG196_40100 [Kitasatospora purpeofusca]